MESPDTQGAGLLHSAPPGSSGGALFFPHKREPGTRYEDPDGVKRFSKLWFRKKQNRDQVKEIFRGVKLTTGESQHEYSRELIKAGASLRFCNNAYIVKQVPGGLAPVTAWNCGRKFCAICSQKKRKKLLYRYLEFFESDSGKILLDSYDLALFTVTLQHNAEDLRTEPYYQELAEHWRNGIKYGAFKKYLAGGFYNTEHTFTDNGHHIHRHALVLISKEYNLKENIHAITAELRDQWKKRTGGSFQIDLQPFREDRTLKENLLEVTKYITKRGKKGVIPWQVIKAVEENNRAKFYNKFGILYRIKELNVNHIFEEELKLDHAEELEKPLAEEKLYFCTGLRCFVDPEKSREQKRKVYGSYSFKEIVPQLFHEKLLMEFQNQISIQVFNYRIQQGDRVSRKYFFNEWNDWRDLQARMRDQKNFRPPDQGAFDFMN